MSEATKEAPEGAKAVTAADIVSKAEPERLEDVEIWTMTSAAGAVVSLLIHPEIGEKCQTQQSPLDGSFIMLLFEFKGGEKNETKGRRFFPIGPGLFSYEVAYQKLAHYKEGTDPVALELKRKADLKLERLQERAAKLAEKFDGEDED